MPCSRLVSFCCHSLVVTPVVTLFPLSVLKIGCSPAPKDTSTTREELENRDIGRAGMPAYYVTKFVAIEAF
jgi:hypothetical protein